MTRKLYSLYLILVLCLIQSCAQLGYTKPETTEDKIYTAYATVGAAYQTIADLAKRNAVTKEQGMRLIDRADKAKNLLDSASAAMDDRIESDAVNALNFAVQILTALETELKGMK